MLGGEGTRGGDRTQRRWRCRRCDLHAKFIIFNPKFIICDAKFIIFNTGVTGDHPLQDGMRHVPASPSSFIILSFHYHFII